MNGKYLFFGGRLAQPQDESVERVWAQLIQRRDWLHEQKIEDLLVFFDALAKHWQDTQLLQQHVYLKNIHAFLLREHLEWKLTFALRGNAQVLDSWQDCGDPDMLYHVQPRGVTVHWLAGNVAILGLFSIFSALVTKNLCFVKASARGYEDLLFFLHTLTEVNTPSINGKDLAECVAVMLIDRTNTAALTYLSEHADVRIAWGGKEAIQTIMALPKSVYTEDIVYGPKYSFAAIDASSWEKEGKKLAQRFAIDVCVFDQYACSSPHTIFVEEKVGGEAQEFAEELAKQLALVGRTLLPKGEIDAGTSANVIATRTEFQITGKVWASTGTEWTVVYTEEPGLANSCFSRVITVKPIRDWLELLPWIDRQKQTLTNSFSQKTQEKVLDTLTQYGIDRCPPLSMATYFEVPWDGMFIFDRLVRWVSTYKK